MKAILAAGILLAAALVLTPSASAAPPQPPCNGIVWVDETVGPAHVYGSPGLCWTVDVRAQSCPDGQWTTVRQGIYTVRVYTCLE
ncbi:MAG: hypothetical protein AABY18_05170 [Candidatus Thermoplasmatota archaeon]